MSDDIEDTRPLHDGQTFEGLTIVIDNGRWQDCTFIDCKLIAKVPPAATGCDWSQSDIVGSGWPEEAYDGVRNIWPHPEPVDVPAIVANPGEPED
ncbi:hypothetical protein [Sphingopyxis macrogoltabida]|uniref:Uncharacterized protein n=1 Tax=Sphingopyxis macrogoltabida TaxID=33050 RepID=A0AAC9AX33_SPHMC|nr:hypothetical protein [Sphingopyxis macrogoltabida]ALJ15370.1 hypothetical protein LH19_21045 [Sphingopyxis macrogoltabida]AMU91619.1 hypothetical protein ATM17_21625 [Sphingopyxis macrogoltabida]